MMIDLPIHVASSYKSPTQIARIIAEQWLQDNMYCLACDSTHLDATTPETRVHDFACDSCDEQYQLKSKSTRFGRKLADSAYKPLKEAIQHNRAPTFLFMHYTRDAWKVRDLFMIPSHFIPLTAIQERRPLRPTARRSGWIGCNILLHRLPLDGRIQVIEDGRIRSARDVRTDWRRFSFLRDSTWRSRGWTSDVLTHARIAYVHLYPSTSLWSSHLPLMLDTVLPKNETNIKESLQYRERNKNVMPFPSFSSVQTP
ncbi:MAG: restriction endonuclease [Methanomassiliicoccales archaeon]|nr:MAG: restriction endonuclease [Methanomassiliicoccales archaeon]